jgi:hypothetical protein
MQPFRPVFNPEWKNYDKPKCPKCGYPQFCGCDSCKSHLPNGIKPYRWDSFKIEGQPDMEVIVCANCDYSNSPDWWMNEEEEQYKVQLPINKKKRKE